MEDKHDDEAILNYNLSVWFVSSHGIIWAIIDSKKASVAFDERALTGLFPGGVLSPV